MITFTITGDDAEEVFSTLKGCTALLSEDVPTAQPKDKPAPVNPTPAAPGSAPIAATNPAPVPTAPVPAVTPALPPIQPPVAAPPTYTHEQIGKAGADLVASNPGLMPTLMELLQRYGAAMVTDLKPEQLGAFATEFRALGAKI